MVRILFALLFLSAASWGQAAGDSAKPDPLASTTTASKPSAAAANPLAAARSLMQEHHYADAVEGFRAIVDREPTAEEAHVGLMRCLVHVRKVDDAEEAGKKALAALPNSAPVHAAFGDVEFRAGKFGEAEAEYKGSLKLDANTARGWFGLGKIYEMVSMRKHAKDAYTKAHELDPDDEQIYAYWLDLLPYAEQLEAVKKHAGDHPTERESDRIKVLSAIAKEAVGHGQRT